MVQIRKEIVNLWENRVGIDANISNFAYLDKLDLAEFIRTSQVFCFSYSELDL